MAITLDRVVGVELEEPAAAHLKSGSGRSMGPGGARAMRVGVIADDVGERLALALGVVPIPLFQTFLGSILARAIMVATKLGIFEALAAQPLTLEEIAHRCEVDRRGLEKLVNALTSADLLRLKGGRYALGRVSRKWLLRASPQSLYDSTLFSMLEAEKLGRLEDFVRWGTVVDFHESQSSPESWSVYQRGMRSLAALSATEVARRTHVPAGARDMLDIGGSHGLFSVAICRRYQGMRAVILDLPAAIEHASPLLAEEEMGDRVTYRPGDALSEDLGAQAYDLVLMSQLAHHFDEGSNRELVRRVARALRPGGAFVLQELVRCEPGTRGGQVGGLMDLYFGLTSRGGTWSLREMAAWQRDGGLVPQKPVWLRTLPGSCQQTALKPGR